MVPTLIPADRDNPADRHDDHPRYFLDAGYDANPDDGDWWLDVCPVTLPGNS